MENIEFPLHVAANCYFSEMDCHPPVVANLSALHHLRPIKAMITIQWLDGRYQVVEYSLHY